MKTVSVKVASAVIAGLGLTVGVVGMVGAQATGNVGTTGEDSKNNALVTSETNSAELRASEVKATNNNPQNAMSGSATVEDGEDDGAATSGGAGNNSTFGGSVTVGQTGGSGAGAGSEGAAGANGTIEGTGEDSENKLNVHSTSNRLHGSVSSVQVTNNNTQNAQSGDATVMGGDDGGNATSGSATNTSTSTFEVNVQQ